jgi:hypothetical protein
VVRATPYHLEMSDGQFIKAGEEGGSTLLGQRRKLDSLCASCVWQHYSYAAPLTYEEYDIIGYDGCDIKGL